MNAYEFERERQKILQRKLKQIESVTSVFKNVLKKSGNVMGKAFKNSSSKIMNNADIDGDLDQDRMLSPMERRRE